MFRTFWGFCLTLLLSSKASSQDKIVYHKLKLDTINLSGIVTTYEGNPIVRQIISSKAPSLTLFKFKQITQTDSSGHFNIQGALFNDTLTLSGNHIVYGDTIFNEGSRYLHIRLKSRAPEIGENIIINAKRTQTKAKPSTFKVVDDDSFGCGFWDVNAEFPGGKDRLAAFLAKRVQYPALAIAQNREGRVCIEFDIRQNGGLGNFKVLSGIGLGCEEAVIIALKQSPKWSPAIENERAVITQQSVSFIFKLTE